MSYILRPHSIFYFFCALFLSAAISCFLMENVILVMTHDRGRSERDSICARERWKLTWLILFVCFPADGRELAERMKFQFEMNERDFPSCWPHNDALTRQALAAEQIWKFFEVFCPSRLWQASYIYNTARNFYLEINEILHRKRPLWGSAEGGWKNRKEREIEEKKDTRKLDRANLSSVD